MNFGDDTFIKFGTALPALEEDDVQSRKPINVEDQIATDENGRRRFHGAFTGGFSAGFWNTVGSLEGWKPQEFKSSRQEKATRKRQLVEDFMDDEDKGEFGIAPQRVQAREDYTKTETPNKKQKISSSSGPIPGVPVLQSLLQPARDNIATRLLKQMGWREGQGIGARQTKVEKKRAQSRNQKELYIMEKYGCDLGDRPSTSRVVFDEDEEDNESVASEEEITFAPDDFDPFLASVKENTFGLGYSGLDRNPVLGKRFNLFQPLEILDKNNKKLSISGQAFGVGAFEVEDEDIYGRDDMSKYDFSLDDKTKKKAAKKTGLPAIQQGALDGFEAPQSSERGKFRNKVYKVSLPNKYQPRNWTERRSRFDRLPEEKERELSQQNSYKLKGLGRHDLNPEQRSALINDTPGTSSKVTEEVKESPRNKFLDMINKKYESFEKSKEIVHETLDVEAKKSLEEAKKKTAHMPKIETNSKAFRPFPQNPEKQKRYDQFCELPMTSDEEYTKFLATIQPIELSQWDREMEKKEFVQARKLFRPLDGLMLDRFVTETELEAQKNVADKDVKRVEETGEPGAKKQIQMKRIKTMWKPKELLCKRFNVPEPFGGSMVEEKVKEKKKPKYSVFDYLEVSVNKREAFITPVIIPEKLPKEPVHEKQKEVQGNAQSEGRLSSKDLFERELMNTPTVVPIAGPSSQIQQRDKQPKERVKSELEQQSIALVNTHPAEKRDLFKAIFDSSDSEEEEGDGDANENSEQEKAAQKPDVSELLKKSANEINILRNNSPPRGIFANLFKRPAAAEAMVEKESVIPEEVVAQITEKQPELDKRADVPKILFRRKEERATTTCDDHVFGPKPPPRPQGPVIHPSSAEILPGRSEDKLDKRLTKALLGRDIKIVEEWVEKDKVSSKKKKSKDKKHKKEKKKDKKRNKEK